VLAFLVIKLVVGVVVVVVNVDYAVD